MENSLAIRSNNSALTNMDEIERAALAMSKSGYFQDAREQAQAITKIFAGREMGFGPFASMTGIYIISGRPSIGANLMAAAVKASGRYNYRVVQMDDAACEIAFFEGGKECGRSRFTLDEARKAGTKNLDKFPRNMLFARAMSNGCRWYCPDVFLGAPTYTPEELGADVNEAGDVISAEFTQTPTQPAAKVTQPPAPKPDLAPMAMTAEEAYKVTTKDGKLYCEIDSDTLTHMANSIQTKLSQNGYTGDDKAIAERKLAAILVILANRQ